MPVHTHTVDDLVRRLETLLDQRRFAAFARALNEAAARDGQRPELWRLAAEYFRVIRDPAGLAQALLRWAALAPKDPEPRLELADLFARQGATDKAAEALSLAEQVGADPAITAAKKACLLLADHRYQEAAAAAETAVSASGSEPSCGLLLEALGRLARNLAAASGREEHQGWIPKVAERAARLGQDDDGLFLGSAEGPKRIDAIVAQGGAAAQQAADAVRKHGWGCAVSSAALLEVAQAAAAVHDGSFWGLRSRVYIVEPDLDVLTLALARFDAASLLTDEAVTWVVGPGAVERFRELAAERFDEKEVRITAGPNTAVRDAAQEATEAVRARIRDWYEQATAYYRKLDRRHWANILGERPERPPRILFITTAYSSYMRFATRDLARAFERLGWQVRIAIESRPAQYVGGAFVAKEVAEFRPDLIWQINYPRSNWPGAVPDGVPFVCWDQDAMTHLASRERAEAMGRFDFLATQGSGVGYIKRYGYPVEQLLQLPMCVDRSVFYPDPADRPEVDVCYVSHHGWPIEHRIAEVLNDQGPEHRDRLRAVLTEYAGRLEELFAERGYPLRIEACRLILAEACKARALWPDPQGFDRLNDYLYRVLANAIWRHQAVRWVAACDVGLRLHGLGWKQNGEFSRFAGGPVEHGEPLRKTFAGAKVALQAVLAGNNHQRLWEAAACGTVVLMRYHPGDELYGLLRNWLEMLENGLGRPVDEVIPVSLRTSLVGRYAYEFIRVGLADADGLLTDEVLRCVRRAASIRSVRDELADAYEDLVFRNPADLREKLGRILHDESHRKRLREALLRAADLHSYDAQIPRLVRRIRERLIE